MFYSFDHTIPANTARADPDRATVKVQEGRIVAVDVLFPPGPRGLAGVRVLEREHQLYPTNPDAWLVSDNDTIRWVERHDLEGPEVELHLEGYNLDDTYPHTITWRFNVIGPEERDAPAEDRTLLRRIYDGIFGSA